MTTQRLLLRSKDRAAHYIQYFVSTHGLSLQGALVLTGSTFCSSHFMIWTATFVR